MLSFVRDFFIPAIARPYLTEALPGRKSAGTTKDILTKEEVAQITTTSYQPKERSEVKPTLKEPRNIPICSGNVNKIGESAIAPIPEVPIKDAETSSKDSQKGGSEITVDNAILYGHQTLPTITAPAEDPTKFNRAQVSPIDSGYASENSSTKAETTASSKTDKMRRVRKRVSDKFKNIWQKASDAIRDPRPHDHVDCKEPDAVLEDTTVPDEVDIDTDDEDDGSHPRCDFKTIEATSNEKIEALVRLHCDESHDPTDVRVVDRLKGTFNFAAIVSLSRQEEVHRYVVRIPGHATLAHWITEDAYMMDREVQLIQHIGKNTSAPVATIVHHSTEHTNVLGLPYILMTELPGEPASSIWYDDDYENDDFELVFRHTDIPSTATEKKRITFLRSLARVMTDIQSLSFDMGGMPIISEDGAITLGPMYEFANNGSDDFRKHDAFDSAQHYGYKAMIRQLIMKTKTDSQAKSGALKFFNLIFSQSVFKAPRSGKETFTIHHTDLDLQNIFVDDQGNVTGIIDWDKAFAAPRCMGAAAAPLFLQKDWLPDYLNNLSTGPHMGWRTHQYREIYAAALVEAGNPDAIFTTKSALYRAALSAVYDTESDSMHQLLDKVLREVPNCRIKTQDFKRALGLGWPDAEKMLKAELPKIFAPELPPADTLEKVDVGIAMREWWLTFDAYLEEENKPIETVPVEETETDQHDDDSNTETAAELG
jgi:aminoglycoside phosphotransferase (APT) family kinase protein